MEFQTKRLYFRRFDRDDAQIITDLISAPEFSDNTSSIPFPYKIEHAFEFLDRQEQAFQKGEAIVFGAFSLETGRLIADGGLHGKNEHQVAELGYIVAKPYWNQGFGTELARAIVNFGFSEWKLRKIIARHFSFNPASGRIMQKIGMIKEGHLRNHIVRNGRICDDVIYGILREEWNG